MKKIILALILAQVFCLACINPMRALAAPRQAAFSITGYVYSIDKECIEILAPRMKQPMRLILAKDIEVIDLSNTLTNQQCSLSKVKEKYLAVCSGTIGEDGFICRNIEFVRNTDCR